MVKKVLHIVNKNALGGGIGTIINYLNQGLNEGEMKSDTLLTEYQRKENGYSESGDKNYIFRPKDSILETHDAQGNILKEESHSHNNLKNKLEDYDLIHVHGIPHYGILEHLQKIKSKPSSKKPKIINTAHSSVKQEFLAQYENLKKDVGGGSEDSKEEFNSLKYLLNNNILDDPSKFGETFWGSAIYRQEEIMTLSDSVQHMNEAYKKKIINEYAAHENAHKHIVIPNGVKPVDSYVPRPKKKRIMFVGRFAKEKGVDEFMDSLPYLFEKHPDAEVKFVGGSKEKKEINKYKEDIKKNFENHFKDKPEHNLEKILSKIHFTGWITDKKQLQKEYEWADYVINPSVAESFCLTASEALMYKRIPILTATDALKDLYIDKGIALGIDPKKRHGKGIAETLNKILKKDSSEEYDELIEKGEKFVKENYSFNKMIDNQIKAYHNLTKEING